MKKITMFLAIAMLLLVVGCGKDQESADAQVVDKQQRQYAVGQPIPIYDWSLERELAVNLYNLRNKKVATHAVWRSYTGQIEGDCKSMGYGLPYDVSLTNPKRLAYGANGRSGVVEQAEPNGIFASKNTTATWVLCVDGVGGLTPIYVETFVTVYPYPVKVDYDKNRVVKAGKANTTIKMQEK